MKSQLNAGFSVLLETLHTSSEVLVCRPKPLGLDLWEGVMPHRTMLTSPEVLEEMVLRHAAYTRWICLAAPNLSKSTVKPEVVANYVRNVRQAECIARFLHTPIRKEDPPDKVEGDTEKKVPCSLQSGYTGVFLRDDADGLIIEEHCMSINSPMQGLLHKSIGTEADGWKLIAIKF